MVFVLSEEAGCCVCQWSLSSVVFVIVTPWLLGKQWWPG